MDRFEEFREIIANIQSNSQENETILRNRNSRSFNSELKESIPEIYNFSKSFTSECSLINVTLVQLSDKLKKMSQKSEQVTFSITNATSPKSNNGKEIGEALNICSMNLSIMGKKLQDRVIEEDKCNEVKKSSLFTLLFKGKDEVATGQNPILVHLRLIVSFLEGRVGRLTEEFESFNTRRRNRESLMNQNAIRTTLTTSNTTTITTSVSPKFNNSSDEVMSMLQVENSRMLEEMSRSLFETLNTTETQVLEISRLQATLQSHLTVQHDLTCRLFEDSISTVEDTKKGNEYLKRSGTEGSLMRKFLVTLILMMSLLLLLLHYFNK